MARILIDARKIRDYGIGTYIQQLAKHLALAESGHSFDTLVLKREEGRVPLPTQWRQTGVTYEQYSLGELLFLGGVARTRTPDLFHVPHYNVPLRAPLCTVVTIHDIVPLLFPQYWNSVKRAYAAFLIRNALTQARIVLTGSQSTKRSLLERFTVDEDKIVVTPYGLADRFRLGVRKEALAVEFRRTYSIQRPYILFVSNLKPHKGMSTLLAAFRVLIGEISDLDLVMTGGAPVDLAILAREVRSHGINDRVRLLGRLEDSDVLGAYAAAEVFVLPSLYEGFGFPVLEAMAAETPVVCSDGGSLPEVVGDAAVMFERGNTEGLVEALRLVLSDSSLREVLRSKGLQRADSYSWKRTAEMTLDAYAKVIA